MKKMKLPAQVYEAFCPRCGCRVEYALFQASFYNFRSCLEITSETLVRLDLDAVHYLKLEPESLLAAASESLDLSETESRWIDQSKQVFCRSCKTVFEKDEARDNRMCCEEQVEAYCAPPNN
jgi:hypothetical protein